ncbi:MAG: YihY/virulence factor BrkB family protein [Oscillatoria princeps RMCB-10]|jgi:membrane protein|nr:YihY/virulence factor BrkB family protein [Oscillatoria princeps RMCB-10]
MPSFRFVRFFGHLNLPTLRQVFQRAGEQRLAGLSAEMAYNAMLALFPAILAVLTAIGLFESLQSTLNQLARQLGKFAPLEVQTLIRGFISEITVSKNQSLFSISFFGAIWAFSGAISAAIAALDQIYRIPPERARPFWKAKLVSLALSVGTILLLIAASALVFVSDLIVQMVAEQSCRFDPNISCKLVPTFLSVWRLFSWPIALGIVSAAFGFIYRYGPSRRPKGTPIMPGAILAAVSWAVISGLFRLYVSNFGNYNRSYGAVGAVIVLMLWLYLSSWVMLIGAQLNVTVGEAMQRAKFNSAILQDSQPSESKRD